jgi:hypothetical protein
MQVRTVVLSGRSLFPQGVANRLRQYLQPAEIEILDPRQSDVIARIATAPPGAVILDGTDSEIARRCSLSSLLLASPELKVIVLDPREDRAQIVTSEQHLTSSVRDLAALIEQSV